MYICPYVFHYSIGRYAGMSLLLLTPFPPGFYVPLIILGIIIIPVTVGFINPEVGIYLVHSYDNTIDFGFRDRGGTWIERETD
jgi:hypothetical protein